MIAQNYRRFPESLIYQLELELHEAVATMQAMRVKAGAVWAAWERIYAAASPDVRGVVPIPAWLAAANQRSRTLAAYVRSCCMNLA